MTFKTLWDNAITGLVDDTSPTLGGNLDVDGNEIIGSSETGTGGNTVVKAGPGTTDGGDLNLHGGTGGSNLGGNINLYGGSGDGTGGNVTIRPSGGGRTYFRIYNVGDTDYVGFQCANSPAQSIDWLFPATNPTVGQVLSSSAPSGTTAFLSWISVTGNPMSADLDTNGNYIENDTAGGSLLFRTVNNGGGSGGAFSVTTGTGTSNGGAVNFNTGTGTVSGGGINLNAGDGAAIGGNITLECGIDSGDESNNGYVLVQNSSISTAAVVMRFRDAGSGNDYVGLKAPDAVTGTIEWTLPDAQQTQGMMMGIDLGEFAHASLPSAATYPNCWALVTDADPTSNTRTIVRSDGTNWKVVVAEGATVTTGD